ncbi:spermatogenesis-associated protein 46-like [Amia ocellicauda]|uniref:spermatogenesis-associated protein 46-like n=1 Tax=Amia ocellicauda TaxID=2972642 RepID=UPI003463F556
MTQDSLDQGSGVCVQRKILAWFDRCDSAGLSESSTLPPSSPSDLDPQVSGEQIQSGGGPEEPIGKEEDALTCSPIDVFECTEVRAEQESRRYGPAELPAVCQDESGLGDAGSSVSSGELVIRNSAYMDPAFVKAVSIRERVGNVRRYKCAGCLRYYNSIGSLQVHIYLGSIDGYSCSVFYRTLLSIHQSTGQQQTGRFQRFTSRLQALFKRFRGALTRLLQRFQGSLSRLFNYLTASGN